MIKASLTEGNLFKKLIIFALPFLLSNILQAIYGVVDLAIVTAYSTDPQIAAVNVGSQVMLLVTNVLIGFSVGVSVLTALFIGKNDSHKVGSIAGTMLSVFSVFSIVLTIVLLLSANSILDAMNTPDEAKVPAYEYLAYTLLGTVFIVGYNIIAGMQRGAASTKPALLIIGIAGVVNLLLDIYFVKTLKMGAKGAGIATLLAHATAFFAMIILLYVQRKKYSFTLKSLKPDLSLLKKILVLGLPTAIQQFAIQLSFMVLMTLVNAGGTNYTNAYGYVSKFSSFAILPYVAISSAITSISGQCIGAGKYKRATNAMFTGILIMAPLGAIMVTVANVFGSQLLGVLTSDAKVLALAAPFLAIISFEYIVVFTIFALHAFLTSAGKTPFIMVNSFISSFVARIPLAYILYPHLGFNGLALAVVLSPIISTIIASIYYLTGKWKPKAI